MKRQSPRPHRLIPFALFFVALASVRVGAQSVSAGTQSAANLQEHLRHSTALDERDLKKSEDAGVAEMESQRLQSVLRPMRRASQGRQAGQEQPTTGRIELSTSPGGNPLFIDGAPAGEIAEFTRIIELTPGPHTVEIVFPNATRWSHAFTIVAGRKYCVTLAYLPRTISVPHDAQTGGEVETIDLGYVTGTICDCGEQGAVPAAGNTSRTETTTAAPPPPQPPPPSDEEAEAPVGSGGPSAPQTTRAGDRTAASRTPAGHAPLPERRLPPPPPVTSQPPATSTSVTEVREEYAVVRVFYGTDRKPTGSRRADKFYGGERSERDTYAAGVCDVSIPKTHKTGQLEAPSILRLEFSADPARHVMLQSVTPLGREDFFSQLRESFARAGGAHALVFIHGYNVTFEDAARRTAQIAYDLGFNGVPLMYSWPSRGSLLGYRRDEESVELAVPHLKQFLEDVASELGAGARIHLIAHSMGNRALTNALRGIAAGQHPSPLFNQVILTAPDIDANVFLNEIAPAIQKTAAQVTLYASSDDKALAASRRIHGVARAGESGDHLLTIDGIVTVDASGIDTSLLGHSYYAELKSVLDDMDAIIRHGYGPSERKLHALTRGSATYWSLVAAAATTAAATAAAVPSPPASGGGAWDVSHPAPLLVVALVLAAVLFFVWRLIRRRRGAGSIHS